MIRRLSTRSGSALISTMLVIAVLTIIVVAFLQSMTVEQKTARSYLNKYRAELAAQAGTNSALAQLRELLTKNPYHGIGYSYAPGTTAEPVYPVVYGAASSTAVPPPRPYYLISGTKNNFTELGSLSKDPDDSVAVNVKRGDNFGWMGSPVNDDGSVNYRECRAPWVYILKDDTKGHQPDLSKPDYNPYVARFAYWVEDETSKLDLMLAGNAKGPGGAFLPPPTTNLVTTENNPYTDAIAWQPTDLDLGAIPIMGGKPIPPTDSGTNSSLINFLRPLAGKIQDARILGQNDSTPDSEPAARFYTTVGSVSNELAGTGRRRININALVHDNSTNPAVIGSDIDDIAFAISGQHIILPAAKRSKDGLFSGETDNPESAPMPKFGERFFSDPFPNILETSMAKNQIYLTKIAANIRDYIDKDSNPTFVDSTGDVIAGNNVENGGNVPIFKDKDPVAKNGIPAFPNYEDDESMPIAIGKEAIPYLAKNAFVVTLQGSTLGVDQFFSFFNPYTKDFKAPPGTFLRCFNRLQWKRGNISSFQMKPFYLDLKDTVFPAGKTVVITTSAASRTDPRINAKLNPSGLIWRPSSAPNSGVIDLMFPPDACLHSEEFATAYQPPGNISYDISTKIVWGNNNGYLGGFPAITLTSFNLSNYAMSPSNTFQDRGNSMQGNNHASRSGDSRSIDEPLIFNHNTNSVSVNGQHRFFDDPSINLSESSNPTYIFPTNWPDWAQALDNTATTSYAVVRDQSMTSIGELGYIYDPYRVSGGSSIEYVRGGGRTLRVGQPDDVIKNDLISRATATSSIEFRNFILKAAQQSRFSPEWNQSAWRLTDVFGVLMGSSPTATAPLEGKVNRTTKLIPPQTNGKLNLNSVLRDDGAAFRSLLRGFKYLGGQALSETNITDIVASLKAYLEKTGPMIERGELSQLMTTGATPQPLFAVSNLAGQPLGTSQDRVREEIFRRIIEMVTTRSNSFTVYAIGQSLRERASGDLDVLGTATSGVTYRIDPTIADKIGAAIPDSGPTEIATDFTPVPLYSHP